MFPSTHSRIPILFLLLFSSCVGHQRLVNFNEGAAFPVDPEAIGNSIELRIQPDDILFIEVQALDPLTAAPYNMPVGQRPVMQNVPGLQGYRVDAQGMIDMPGLGPLPVGGKTTTELREDLRERLSQFLTSPTINIRFINLRLTVLGEVESPGAISVPDEQINILEALGLAGGVSKYGNRERILLIREQGGERVYHYLNLHDRSLFQSDFFYLRQNDILYVEPLNAVTYTVADPTSRILPWVGVVTTILNLILILTR
jgi:polysaccharide export outer membrane protein